jgi:hypothetical protein
MALDWANKKIGIFGIQGSGKTHFARELLKQFKAPFIYRITGDFDNVDNAVIFKQTDKYLDLDFFLDTAKRLGINGKIDAIVLDEADLFMTEARIEQGILNELLLMHRHFNLAFILISRAPQDIPRKVFESCHYIVNFKADAPLIRKKFIDLHEDYKGLLPLLDFDRHNFIIKEIGNPPKLYSPLTA